MSKKISLNENLYIKNTNLNLKDIVDSLNGDKAIGSIAVEDVTCKNILDISNIKSANGVAVTKEENGLVSLNGTPTASYTHFLDIDESVLTDGETYTFSSTNYNAQVYLQVERKNKSTLTTNYYATHNKEFTLTINKSVYSYAISIQTHSIANTGTISNLTAGWQIEKGNVATNYAEHKDFANDKEFVLYNNSNGSNETITLLDNASNYKLFKIYYRSSDGVNYKDSKEILAPNNARVTLRHDFIYNGIVYTKLSVVVIEGKTITQGNTGTFRQLSFGTSGSVTSSEYNYIFITKVVGYK